MNIAKIWKDDYPWDIRVEKICKALINDGHKVHLICRNISRYKTRDEIDDIQIHRLYPIRNNLLNNICSIAAFFNPIWLYKIFQVVKQEKIDIILVRDLPLVISALLISKICKIPVFYDMAENYPSMWKDHVDKKGLRLFNHFLKNPKIATFMEDYALKRVNHIIVVVEESRNRIIKKGVPKNLISIVSNTPDLKKYNEITPKCEHPPHDRFELLYAGYVNMGRGLDVVVKSIPIIREKIKLFCFTIIGDGEYLDELKKITNELGVDKYVVFLGWLDSKFIPPYIYNSDVCVVPHDTTDFINSTIPNKLFDYMACKKPVIVSDAAPLKRIVNETDCGMVFRSRDMGDFAEKVIQLGNSSLREKLGMNGLKAIKSKYNWEHDSQILKQIFRNNPSSN